MQNNKINSVELIADGWKQPFPSIIILMDNCKRQVYENPSSSSNVDQVPKILNTTGALNP